MSRYLPTLSSNALVKVVLESITADHSPCSPSVRVLLVCRPFVKMSEDRFWVECYFNLALTGKVVAMIIM